MWRLKRLGAINNQSKDETFWYKKTREKEDIKLRT